MADKCQVCGQPLPNSGCTNPDCEFKVQGPILSDTGEYIPEVSKDIAVSKSLSSDIPDFIKGPFLSLEQAATPIDHTGTVQFEGTLGDYSPQEDLEPDLGATRLTDDENYRIIQTVLRESVTEVAGIEEDTSRVDNKKKEAEKTKSDTKKVFTDRPEISRTIRLENPLEGERTVHKLPSRSLSVPSDSASLEKRKAREENYSLDHKDYKIISKAGEGGSGVVYEALQLALKRRVAVKVLKQRRMKAGSRSRTRTKELEKRKNRFLHEVHVTAKLQHPNVIPLYDLGINHHGEVFYAMKLINESGDDVQQSWASMVRRAAKDVTTKDIEKNVQIFEKVCDAMRYAHSEQIVHRDLKPDNVMVGDFGEVLVIDWGMALDLSEGYEPFTAGGTTSYMPPEMGKHYLKQSQIHKLSHKLMVALGEDRRDYFVEAVLDRGTKDAASELLENKDVQPEIHEMCRELLALEKEERALAEQVNYSSDIYLLGAILYEIAVGHPPHFVPQESCKSIEEKHHREFWLSSNHHIQRLVTINDPLRLSLCNIALGALQLNQEDRYPTVDKLKKRLQGFKNQVQSLQMVEVGRKELAKAEGGEGYHHLLPALESFRGAQSLWPEGDEARRLQTNTACEYARRADHRKDFDAGLSILDEYTEGASKEDENVVSLKSRLNAGKKRAARNRALAAVGWVAAVVLPIGVWIFSLMATSELRDSVKNLELTVTQKQNEIKESETKLEETRDELKAQESQLVAARKEVDEAAVKVAEADQKVIDAEQKVTDAESQVVEANQQLASAKTAFQEAKAAADRAMEETMTAQSQAANAKRNAEMAKADLQDALANVDSAKQEAEKAEQDAELARADAETQQKKLKRLRFESVEGQYNSEILPIPLDLRRGKLDLVRNRLQQLKALELPQLKNGWVAGHFAKVVDVAGIQNQLGKDSSVIKVLPAGDGNWIVIGTRNDQPSVWKSDGRDGGTLALKIDLPSQGRIASADLTPDGRLLALSLDEFSEDEELCDHLFLVDLQTGERVSFALTGAADDELTESKSRLLKNGGVIGSRAVSFVKDPNEEGKWQLLSLEELSGYKGLKERLQLATRTIAVNEKEFQVGPPSVTPISATTRDERRVRYLAAINETNDNRSVLGMVYSSLDERGAEIFRLETMKSNDDGEFDKKSVAVARFPTAMHIDTSGNLFCGFADGQIERCGVDELASGEKGVANEHESAISVLTSTEDGRVIGGSIDGVLIVFDKDLNLQKRLLGQEDRFTSLAVVNGDAKGEFRMASGGLKGSIRIWEPDGTLHDAKIVRQNQIVSGGSLDISVDNAVTCGAVDQYFEAGNVPASVYGTADGHVWYYDSKSMRANDGGQRIQSEIDPGSARLSVAPPPGSFDTSFGNFDCFGIVGDQFVLLQSDGRLLTASIDRRLNGPSSDLAMVSLPGSQKPGARFVPTLASIADQDFFFTNNPIDDSQIVYWSRPDSKSQFEPTPVEALSSEIGRIKRLKMSPDGEWLAVIRETRIGGTTGEYVTEFLQIDSTRKDRPLRLTSTTNRYRVGDPAFVGFSKDSKKLVLDFHKTGIDRETWVEHWALRNGRWTQSEPKQLIDDQRVDLLGWDGNDLLVTKINRLFYLSRLTSRQPEITKTPIVDLSQPEQMSRRLRSVYPTGRSASQYVLFDQGLERYDGDGQKDTQIETVAFKNARDIRVFGDRAIVLDDIGFHLVSSDLKDKQLIVRRKIAVTSLSLSKDRLAINYDVGGLCRIMNLSGKDAVELGRIDNVRESEISPDGRWVSIYREGKIEVYSIEEKLGQPAVVLPVENVATSTGWRGKSSPTLLIAIQGDDGDLSWREIDPIGGAVKPAELPLPQNTGPGVLVDFDLADQTEKYLALVVRQNNRNKLTLWALQSDEGVRQLTVEDGFDATPLSPLEVSFSEMGPEDPDSTSTRLVVLTNGAVAKTGVPGQSKSTKIFVVSDWQTEAQDDEEAEKRLYNVFEVEGVLEVTDGRQLIDAAFSGDGKSLLEVDTRGIKVLLSQDW